MGGVQVESVSQMNRVQELFLMLSSDQARQKELFMGGGGLIQREDTAAPYAIKVDSLAANKTRNMSMTIISGLTAQNKYLWPNAGAIEFTFELDDAEANLHFVDGGTSNKWQIENVYITADVIEMDSALLNKYVEHLA